MIGGVFPVVLIVLSITVIVAILVACTSRNDKAPRYHCVRSICKIEDVDLGLYYNATLIILHYVP